MQPLSSEDRLVVQNLCDTNAKSNQLNNNNLTCTLGSNRYFIKYGLTKSLKNRIHTQPFLFDAEPNDTRKPRIAKLLDHWRNDPGWRTYVVIEYIEVTIPAHSQELDVRVEETVRWLAGVQAPLGHTLGPVGRGLILHHFFRDGEAPLAFRSVKALELYVAEGRRRLPRFGQGLEEVKLQNERLVLMQSFMYDNHFGIDDQGKTVLMGFRSISFLPESFGIYSMRCTKRYYDLSEKMGWAGAESNMKPMGYIAATLGMTAHPALGLNEDGEKAPRTQANKVGATSEGLYM